MEVAHEARTTSLVDPDAGMDDDVLDSGRITLTRQQTGADVIDEETA